MMIASRHRKLEVIKSSLTVSFAPIRFPPPAAAVDPFVHSFESDSISSRILSNFHRPLSLALLSLSHSLCECSFRRRLLEFMDMAFNPTNWWTIVYSSSPPTEGRDAISAQARDVS